MGQGPLPEHLWLASLALEYGLDVAARVYNAFMDAFDAHWSHDFVALGLISDFSMLDTGARSAFLDKNRQMIDEYFHKPLGRIMSLYPDGPLLERDGPIDPFAELARLRTIVMKLAPGKDKFAGRVRAIPLNRLFKHNKLFIFKGLRVADLLAKYPGELTEEEQYHVESFARSTLNTMIRQRRAPDPQAWPKYFWRHNYDLLPYRPTERRVVGATAVSAQDGTKLANRLQQNAHNARHYLGQLLTKLRLDLYDPDREEVLFGLFARLTRLYVLMADDPFLWARDVSGIMLRPLTETAITFLYLAKRGGAEDFRRFIEYGEG